MSETPIISKISAHILGKLLSEYGVRHIVVSSGSRCAPLSVTFSRMGCFELHPVVDERSAGFIALGISLTTDEPVAMVCTSGSAALNYAPALAEAYYRRVPLIAVTADRPLRCVDQRAGQTIHQAGALDAVVRWSVDIPDCGNDSAAIKVIGRHINKALSVCTGHIKGPVHINMRFDTPLTPECQPENLPKLPNKVCRNRVRASVRTLRGPNMKMLVFIGGVRLDKEDIEALEILSRNGNVAVVAEVQTNIPYTARPIRPMHLDRILDYLPEPDMVAFVGGDMISNRFKSWLCSLENTVFISGGYEDGYVSPFGKLKKHYNCKPADFFKALTKIGRKGNYCSELTTLATYGKSKHRTDAKPVKAFQDIVDSFKGLSIHVSNGTCARIIQHIKLNNSTRLEINRGVSGIEGSTSTAKGAALIHKKQVLLFTGDMSFFYDIGAITSGIPKNLKIVVLDNNGGDIFRNISTTSELPEREELFAMPQTQSIRAIAEACGIRYLESSNPDKDKIKEFLNKRHPAILRLKVRPSESTGLI